MKKIITPFIIFTLLILSSCNFGYDNTKTMVIQEIRQLNGFECYYVAYGKGYPSENKIIEFVDSCGKFKIGDQISLKKETPHNMPDTIIIR